MKEALKEAEIASVKGEVPVGCVLVFQGKIIARSHNLVETLSDATAHAEMLCLKEAAKILNNWRLLESTLYCTLEPCIMCAGALILSRVKKVVYGAPDFRHGAGDLLHKPHPIHQLEVQGGVLADESSHLLKSFFKDVRCKNYLTN